MLVFGYIQNITGVLVELGLLCTSVQFVYNTGLAAREESRGLYSMFLRRYAGQHLETK